MPEKRKISTKKHRRRQQDGNIIFSTAHRNIADFVRIFIRQANMADNKQKAIQTQSNNHNTDKKHSKLTSNLATRLAHNTLGKEKSKYS